MEKRLRFGAVLVVPFLLLAMSAGGCGGGMFKNVIPKKNAQDVDWMPTFTWTVKEPVRNLQFELYRAVDFRVETKEAVGQPILKIANFSAAQAQSVPLSNPANLMKQFAAEGIFLTEGYDALEAGRDYVWVLRAIGPNGPIVEVYKFRTRKDYYRPD